MISARAEDAGISSMVRCNAFRAVGFTSYLVSDGAIKKAEYFLRADGM